jgi:hypothetical protein
MPSDARSNTTWKLYSSTVVAVSLVLLAIIAGRSILNFRHQYFLTHVEGAWLTCAHDFLHGVFYRPLFGPLGYGGTRYFPLYFVATGIISKTVGVSLQTAALSLSAISVFGICASAYAWMRRSGVVPHLCLAGVGGILAAATAQQALLGAKGDALAADLNLSALLLCLIPGISRRTLYRAAGLFTLAFATKLTTVFGVAAVVLSWAFARRYKDAMQLAIATAAGYVAVLITMYVASGGRVFGIFRACASGGGSLAYTLQAPLHLLSKAMEVDPIFLLFLIPAAAFGATAFREQKTDILPLYFVLSLLVSVVIFGSPGIGINHLLDLHVAAILLLIISFSRASQPALSTAGIGVLALSLLAACGPTLQALHGDLHRRSISADAREIMAHVADDGRPVLAENAEVLLAAGKTPYVLDPFMFRILAATHPDLTNDFWDKMNHRGFAAIVLQFDPSRAEGKIWYAETHFGGEFLRDLEANYALQRNVGQMWVFAPK